MEIVDLFSTRETGELSSRPYPHGGPPATAAAPQLQQHHHHQSGPPPSSTMGPALNPSVVGPAPPQQQPPNHPSNTTGNTNTTANTTTTSNNNNNNHHHPNHHHHHHQHQHHLHQQHNNNNNNAGGGGNVVGGGGVVGGPGTGHMCAGCGRLIQDRFLLHALDRYWHTGCLKCSCCQAQLGEIGKSCFTKAGMILCRNDYVRLFGSDGSCMGCGQKIPASELVYRVSVQASMPPTAYHIKCFVCVSCRQPLQPGDRYGLVNGSLVCEHHHPNMGGGGGGGGAGAGGLVKGHMPGTALAARASHKVC